MQRLVLLWLLVMLLVACVDAPSSPVPLAYGTVVAFTDPFTGKYDTVINLFDKPIDANNPRNVVGKVHAGERVGIMERRADGNVRIRTNTMLQGWMRIEALKDISDKG